MGQLDTLFGFLSGEAPLDNLLCSYFDRMVSYLLGKKADRVLEFLKGKDNIVEHFLKHTYSASIADVITKLLNCVKSEVADEWLAGEEFIPVLVEKLSPEQSAATHEYTAQILSDIIITSFQRVHAGHDSPKLFDQINEEVTLQKLNDQVFAKPNTTSTQYGCNILVELAQGNKSHKNDTRSFEELPPIFRVLGNALPKIKTFLETPGEEEMATTNGKLNPPFGITRVRVLEVVQVICLSKYTVLYQRLLEENLFATCFEIFFNYPWNNFVHLIVTRCSQAVLECNDEEIITKLISQTNLHERIGEAGKVPEDGENNRKGYMGHLGLIASALRSTSEVHSALDEILKQSDVWTSYIDGDFAAIKKVEATPLGNAGGEEGDRENRELDALISHFHEVTKKSFEDDFPDSFTPCNDESFDILIHPTDNKLFTGINTDEIEFGDEFNSDDEFMASDEEEDYE